MKLILPDVSKIISLAKDDAKHGRYDSGIKKLELLVEAGIESVRVYNELGCLHGMKKNLDKSLENFQEGFRIDPNNPVINCNLGLGYLMLDDKEKAHYHLEIAVKHSSQMEKQLKRAIESCEESGAYTTALIYQRVLKHPQKLLER